MKVNVIAERCVSSMLTARSAANNLTNPMCADIVTDDRCVLVAHLNVDHNLPAQGDIASFSLQWSDLFASALKKGGEKTLPSDPCDRQKMKDCKGGRDTAKGPIKA